MKPALNSLALACCTMFIPVLSAQSAAIRQGSNAAQLDQTDQSEHSLAARTYAAQTLLAGGQYAAAEHILRAVLDAIEQREARGVDAAITLDNLANVMFETGRFSEARALLAQAVAILKERLGSQDLRYATVAAHLAAAYERLGFYSHAKQLLLESLGVAKRVASDHFLEADIEDNLGRISIAQGSTCRQPNRFGRR
jgi:tetratricopeptide (TPR) repeat protein